MNEHAVPVPAIEGHPALEDELFVGYFHVIHVPSEPSLKALCYQRMVDGAAKYGPSWCEVDLRQDILEEMLDIYNYIALLRTRLQRAGRLEDWNSELLSDMLLAMDELYDHWCELPPFEGPTSAEWVRQQSD